MRLARLSLSQVRKFNGSLVIPTFEPGLNVIAGPNEAGKSTLVRAIRAAFFERYRSGSVEDLLPNGETPSSASPTVEIAFEVGGTTYVLKKTFFNKKRCTLSAGATALDSDAAEEAVAELLNFSYAGRGGSKREHWGIPGLLWIDQGESHEITPSVEHAADRLRTALESTVGAVASSAGDEILAHVRAQRDKLLTPGGSKPRGEYETAIADLVQVRAAISELDKKIERHEQDVDRLAELLQRRAADQRDKPWEAFQSKLEAAEQALGEVERLQERLTNDSGTAKQLEQTAQILGEQLKGFEKLREDLAKRERELTKVKEEEESAQTRLADCEGKQRAAKNELTRATVAVELARTEQRRRDLEEKLAKAHNEEQRLAKALAEAEEDTRQAVALEAYARQYRVDAEKLAELVSLADKVRELEAKVELAATALTFDLDSKVPVRLNESPIPAVGQQRVTEEAIIALEGVGTITVQPGPGNLAELKQQFGNVEEALRDALTEMGTASVEEATGRNQRALQAADAAKTARRMLKVRAPSGLDTLREEVASTVATKNAAAQDLASLPPPADDFPSLEAARLAHESASTAATTAADSVSAARTGLAECAVRRQEAEKERRSVQQMLSDPSMADKERKARNQLDENGRALVELSKSIADLHQKVDSAQPNLLKQDVQRLSLSAENARNAFQTCEREIAVLVDRLEQEAALGLEEQREERRGTENAAARRLAEIKLRAEALDLLVTRMQEKRDALTRRLQAPLQSRLDHYVRILFPQGRMGLNEDLTPGELTRGSERTDFEQLSHGAREQTALISRLAYADLLKTVGNPTLIMLDDALVHCDGERLEQMKRVIFDAATRHQILLFTCHPERWEGLGAMPRDVRSFLH